MGLYSLWLRLSLATDDGFIWMGSKDDRCLENTAEQYQNVERTFMLAIETAVCVRNTKETLRLTYKD